MRLLVACPKCNRQYDATKLGVGKRFRCRCGELVTVEQPNGHDAKGVCCSHCGAPRAEGALNCSYCGAEFSLHDRDLDTVCPHCFARVGHADKFCRFCGKAINPETVAGQPSNLTCPACGDGHMLTSRAWGDVSAMECQRCGGLWMGNESFKHLTDQAATEGLNVENRERAQTARLPQVDAPPPDGGVRYRPCAVCHQFMVKRNFGRRSGVVIDFCGRHGVWFDADELPRILEWIHDGGLAQANEEEAAQREEEDEQQRLAKVDAVLLQRGKLRQPDALEHAPLLRALQEMVTWLHRGN